MDRVEGCLVGCLVGVDGVVVVDDVDVGWLSPFVLIFGL